MGMTILRQIDEYMFLLDYSQHGSLAIGGIQEIRKIRLLGKDILVASNLKYTEYSSHPSIEPKGIELKNGERLPYWKVYNHGWGGIFDRELFYNVINIYRHILLGDVKTNIKDTPEVIDGRWILYEAYELAARRMCISLDFETVISLDYMSLDIHERAQLKKAIARSEPFMKSIPVSYFRGELNDVEINEAYSKYMMNLGKLMLRSYKEKRTDVIERYSKVERGTIKIY